jgi:hypothetical protein
MSTTRPQRALLPAALKKIRRGALKRPARQGVSADLNALFRLVSVESVGKCAPQQGFIRLQSNLPNYQTREFSGLDGLYDA